MFDHTLPASTASAEATPQPRWEAIATALREDILLGRHAPGERLPNEQQLAERFGVNRHTLRQAVQALAREGHVHVRQAAVVLWCVGMLDVLKPALGLTPVFAVTIAAFVIALVNARRYEPLPRGVIA